MFRKDHSTAGGDFRSDDLGAEVELLLCCARLELDDATARRLTRILEGGVEWERFLALAHDHGLLGFAHRHLSACIPPPPPDILEQLADGARRTAVSGLLLSRALVEAVALLERSGIASVAFKGPTQAMLAYGDATLRPYTDLDLLVRPDDVDEAVVMLEGAGYRRLFESPRVQAYVRRSHHDVTLLRASDSSHLELHWDVISPYTAWSLPAPPLFERAREVALPGGRVQTLTGEDLLHLLCVHSSKHHWERLEWLCSVSELMRRPLDWDEVIARASASGTLRVLLLGLALASRLLGAPVPAAAAARLRKAAYVEPLVEAVVGWYQTERSSEVRFYQPRALGFHLRARDSVGDRVRFGARAVSLLVRPDATDVSLVALPGWLSPLYYVLRPFRLAAEGVRALRATPRRRSP